MRAITRDAEHAGALMRGHRKRALDADLPILCACCSASSLVSGGACAALFAGACCPSGERATASAAASAVEYEPRRALFSPFTRAR